MSTRPDTNDDKNSSSNSQQHPAGNSSPGMASKGIMRQGSGPNRYIFEFNGQKIYEWEQSLEEVNIYIDAPPGKTKGSDFDIKIQPNKLKVGLKGYDRAFIDEKTFGKVDTSESSWYIDESILNIVLIKASRGTVWDAPLIGKETGNSNDKNLSKQSSLDPVTKQKITQELMLERFSEENPGFDFRDAQFNGAVPDPRTFMGGIKYD